MLGYFQVGKATQERLIIERFLVGLQSESQEVEAVATCVWRKRFVILFLF